MSRIPKCPNCGGSVKGSSPDRTFWFTCKSCGERYFLEDGELKSPFWNRSNYEYDIDEKNWNAAEDGELDLNSVKRYR